MMSERLEELMTGYVLHSLTREEEAELQAILTKNPELRAKIQELETVIGLIAYSVSPVAVPVSLRHKIVDIGKKQPESVRDWRNLAIASLTILALALGLSNYSLRQQIASLEFPETQVFALQGKGNEAIGSITLNLEEGNAAIDLRELPSLSSGKYYQMWAVTDDKVIPCGQLQSQGSRTIDRIPIPIAEYSSPVRSLKITLESTPTPRQPSQKVVMTSLS
jgi:anti-sigma-K factor RskA